MASPLPSFSPLPLSLAPSLPPLPQISSDMLTLRQLPPPMGGCSDLSLVVASSAGDFCSAQEAGVVAESPVTNQFTGSMVPESLVGDSLQTALGVVNIQAWKLLEHKAQLLEGELAALKGRVPAHDRTEGVRHGESLPNSRSLVNRPFRFVSTPPDRRGRRSRRRSRYRRGKDQFSPPKPQPRTEGISSPSPCDSGQLKVGPNKIPVSYANAVTGLKPGIQPNLPKRNIVKLNFHKLFVENGRLIVKPLRASLLLVVWSGKPRLLGILLELG
ncbi:hypothetical protein CJ030_MR1G023806 [Morella rubra]|uniref:Uncharacterized protein n=1 Tax=Morella rubra TaxID=262757 RepID=A0A6A1WUL4_9ROSI|nr:hypothetical protein CJ030_MR1G023806 [Morella rubra]